MAPPKRSRFLCSCYGFACMVSFMGSKILITIYGENNGLQEPGMIKYITIVNNLLTILNATWMCMVLYLYWFLRNRRRKKMSFLRNKHVKQRLLRPYLFYSTVNGTQELNNACISSASFQKNLSRSSVVLPYTKTDNISIKILPIISRFTLFCQIDNKLLSLTTK